MVRRAVGKSSLAVLALGATLLFASVAHHVTEVDRLDVVRGPVLALALDGGLAVVVVYGGYRLTDPAFAPEYRRVVANWCLLGTVALVATVAISINIQQLEGRTVPEPTFQLLLAADAGAILGLVTGHYNARTREHVRQAERATTTLEFVNDLFRHDVRNGVSVIFAHADLIERESDDEAVVESVSSIREQAHEMTALIDSTGAIAETVSEESDFGRIDVVSVTEEVAAQVDETFDATVETDLPERAPVAANEAVRSVVTNLAENAAEHNDAADPRVAVSVDDFEETVRLRVADNGSGIAESEKAEVFEPREAGRHGGGLHLVETLVENYGGDVWVEDNDDGGATFVLELPRYEE